jgi:hyperosmotically inducible periplasmic protein
MKKRFWGRALMAAALLASAGVAGAADQNQANVSQGDDAVSRSVRHEVLMYPYYSIWDDISYRVSNGQVELMGAVTQPFKKADIRRLVQKVPGVTAIADEIKVLPLSNFDDRLRLQVAHAIYGDPAMMLYRNQALPPIHIVVENGHVTLTGWVNSDFDKQVAGMRANSSMSLGMVVNNLQVEHPSPKKS